MWMTCGRGGRKRKLIFWAVKLSSILCVSAPLSTNSSPLSPLLSEMMSLSLVTSHLSVSPTQIISTSWLRYKHPPAESRSHWSLMSNGSHLTSSLYSGRHHREPGLVCQIQMRPRTGVGCVRQYCAVPGGGGEMEHHVSPDHLTPWHQVSSTAENITTRFWIVLLQVPPPSSHPQSELMSGNGISELSKTNINLMFFLWPTGQLGESYEKDELACLPSLLPTCMLPCVAMCCRCLSGRSPADAGLGRQPESLNLASHLPSRPTELQPWRVSNVWPSIPLSRRDSGLFTYDNW